MAMSARFAWFLLLTGLLSLAGVAAGCNVRSIITIRYHLMLALAPVGLVALAFVYARHTSRASAIAHTVLARRAPVAWALAMALSSAALSASTAMQPPPDPVPPACRRPCRAGRVGGVGVVSGSPTMSTSCRASG